jgi:cation diffusion facilitator CzcD-associated flavoprotein CzcO
VAPGDECGTARGGHPAHRLRTAVGPETAADPGLESFDGPTFHTAQWRHDVELAGKRIAVIGTGCSAIQAAPAIQPIARQLDIYQRSPGWTIPKMDFAYDERTQRLFERFPLLQRLDRMAIFGFMELGALGMTSRPGILRAFRAVGRAQINRAIKDPDLRAKVTPTDEIGCKRIMLTDEWYPTLAKPNVELVTDPLAEVTAGGLRLENGSERPSRCARACNRFQDPRLRRADGDRGRWRRSGLRCRAPTWA